MKIKAIALMIKIAQLKNFDADTVTEGKELDTLGFLISEGLLDKSSRPIAYDKSFAFKDVYRISEKGRALILMLEQVPMPEMYWLDPRDM